MPVLKLYHGGKVAAVPAMASVGFVPSESGRQGMGVYLTDDYNVACSVSAHRGSGNHQVVFTVEVNTDGGVVQLGTRHDPHAMWAQGGQQVACATHPAWLGHGPFTEYVVRNPHRCKITDIHLMGNVTVGAINNPNLNLRVQGNATLTGEIRCHTITIG